MDLSARAYRWLLRLYPRRFRERYAPELQDFFADQRAEPRYQSRFGAVRFWADVAADLAVSLGRLRRRPAPDSMAPARVAGRSPARRLRTHMDALIHDVRHAWRRLRRRPMFTAAAVLSLALGIGGATLVFSLVDGLVLRPFTYPDADRLVGVGAAFPRLNAPLGFIEVIAPVEATDILEAPSLDKAVVFDLGNRNISGGDRAERVFTGLLWGDPFEVIGMPPLHGRGFTPDDWREGSAPVAIISHRVWRDRFGGDPNLVGRAIRVNGEPVTLVGVMPPGLLLVGTDLWTPIAADPSEWPRNRRQFNVLGRLRAGATIEQLNGELATVASRTATTYGGQYPEYENWRLEAWTWAEALTGQIRPLGLLLLGAVGFVMVLTCANLAGLQLAQATARRREVCLWLALGSGRWRLVRHMLAESLLLAVAGAALGLAAAYVLLPATVTLLPAQALAIEPRVEIGGRVLLFSIGLALATAAVIGILPALQATRANVAETLKAHDRASTAGRGSLRLRRALVAAEVALALILLTGAGLFVRSFRGLQQVDLGFSADNTLTMRLTLPREKYPGDLAPAFFDRLNERLRALPGVEAVGAASQFPPRGPFTRQVLLEGRTPDGETLPTALVTVATTGYFDALGLRQFAGRAFGPEDSPKALPVIVVNRSFATRFFPDGSPIGRRVRLGEPDSNAPWAEIVGIVSDARNRGPATPPFPEAFMPASQDRGVWNQLFLLVRTNGDPMRLLPEVRKTVASLDDDQPVYLIQTLADAVGQSLFAERTATTVLSLFGLLALTLASLGVYGVQSFAVTARTPEFGVRLALGASRSDVTRLVLRQAALVVFAGVVVGLGGAVALARLVSGLLSGVSRFDPLTFAAMGGLLVAVGTAAAYLPARRAGRTDPVAALRNE